MSSKISPSQMPLDQAILFYAGAIVLLTIILYILGGSFWLLFTALVGIDLVQAPFTNFYVLGKILKAIGYKTNPSS